MKNSGGKPRAGAVRKGKKGAQVGTGGHGRKALEGRGPTPKAEDRDYHPAGKAGVWSDEFSQRNYQLAGGRWHLCTIDDATHVLGPEGLRANPATRQRSIKRFLRTAKDAAWAAALDWTRPARRAIGMQKKSS